MQAAEVPAVVLYPAISWHPFYRIKLHQYYRQNTGLLFPAGQLWFPDLRAASTVPFDTDYSEQLHEGIL